MSDKQTPAPGDPTTEKDLRAALQVADQKFRQAQSDMGEILDTVRGLIGSSAKFPGGDKISNRGVALTYHLTQAMSAAADCAAVARDAMSNTKEVKPDAPARATPTRPEDLGMPAQKAATEKGSYTDLTQVLFDLRQYAVEANVGREWAADDLVMPEEIELKIRHVQTWRDRVRSAIGQANGAIDTLQRLERDLDNAVDALAARQRKDAASGRKEAKTDAPARATPTRPEDLGMPAHKAATEKAPTQKAFSTEGTDASIKLWLQKVLDYCAKGGDYLHDAKRYLEYMREAKEEMRDLAGQAQRSMIGASEACNRAEYAITKAELTGGKEVKSPAPTNGRVPDRSPESLLGLK